MAITLLVPLPDPPLPTDTEAVFDSKAGTTLTAQQYMVNVDFNTKLIPAINTATTQITADKNAAATSASNAADSATLAGQKVGLAADQVALATTQANNASDSASSAQASAAAAGAAAGLPSLTGNAGKVLGVNSGATGVAWNDSLPSLTGNAGATLMVNAAGTAAVWAILGLLYVVDQKTSGTGPGGASGFAGAYATRTLNTVISNGIVGASLSADQVTLPPGKYRVYASAPAINVNAHKARLYNVTAGAVLALGGNAYAGSGGGSLAEVRAEFTITAVTAIRLEHRVASGAGGIGFADSFGGVETYSEMLIERVA